MATRKTLFMAIALTIAASVAGAGDRERSLLDQLAVGDESARRELARLYGTSVLPDELVQELEEAAAAGQAQAHLLLAELLSRQDTPQAWDRAKGHLNAAMDLPDAAQVAVTLGRVATLRAISPERDLDQRQAYALDAERLLEAAVVAGEAEAQWHLGYLHVAGLTATPDPDVGMALIEKAAGANHPTAAYWLAHEYAEVARTGRQKPGMRLPPLAPEDVARRMYMGFLQVAADAGNRLALKELDAITAQHGEAGRLDPGVNSTLETARTPEPTFTQAVLRPDEKQGRVLPALFRDEAAAPLTSTQDGDEVGRLRARIVTLEDELEKAHRRIAQLEEELGSVRECHRLQQTAVELNDRGIGYYLAGDYESALSMFRKAAELEHSGALANLALLYLNGYAVPQDLKQAQALLVRAANMGNLVAAENLGELYETGAGLVRDRKAAISWYRRALAMGSEKAAAALQRLGAVN